MKNLIVILFFALFLQGCGGGGGEQTTASSFSFGLQALQANETIGGEIGVYFVPAGSMAPGSEFVYLKENFRLLSASNNTEIPYGVWDIYVVGFGGPGFDGSNGAFCGIVSNAVLNTETAVLAVNLESFHCQADPHYLDMMVGLSAYAQGGELAFFDESVFDGNFVMSF